MECGNTVNSKAKVLASYNRGGRKVKQQGACTGNTSKAAEHFTDKIKEYKTRSRRKRKISDRVDSMDNSVRQDVGKSEENTTPINPENDNFQSKREDNLTDEKANANDRNLPKEPSKRQMKKEKAEQRENAEKEAKKLEAMQKALDYISKWKHARSDWKFMKVRQVWLIDNIFDETAISNGVFPNVLEYFEGCKGMARQQLLAKGMDVVRKVEGNEEMGQVITESIEYKRARELLQILPTET